ncbi:IclR family transcriptional regulator [Cellulomonas shaoxiangyii]|uniref:IclR family transcriptional regulator n=1 Tax=Cellulomonas shaoxiangyii TaxID=2566013 RepID=UPI00140D82E4|nr:IclR family transcriptional regulator [Cellulomonas shaoxiangyii]
MHATPTAAGPTDTAPGDTQAAGDPGASGRNESLSLRRALALLDVCAADPDPAGLSAAELGRRLGVHKSTVLRLAVPLLEAGLLARDVAGGRFRLGPGTLRLGHAYLAALDVGAVADPHLAEVAATTGCTAVLAVPDGLLVRVTRRHAAPAASGRVAERAAAHAPLHCSATGKAVLALSAPSLVDRTVAAGLAPYTSRTITDPGELRAELLRTRRRGFAIDDREGDPEVRGVAAPVLDHTGTVVGALGVHAPATQLSAAAVQAHARTVVLAARAVTRLLGGASVGRVPVPATDTAPAHRGVATAAPGSRTGA